MQGVIQHATINNLAFGRNIEETLRILQALQYVQENPDEVCRLRGPLPARPSCPRRIKALITPSHRDG